MSQFSKEYRIFFESPAGADFLTTINGLIDTNHQKAEQPGMAEAYMQRAKGNREIMDHINSVVAERGKALSK